jgi:hypothetical protein
MGHPTLCGREKDRVRVTKKRALLSAQIEYSGLKLQIPARTTSFVP